MQVSPRGPCIAIILAGSLLAARPAFALPAFPGAEGFGAIATGGRGGRVVKVTTLDPAGPGSLQEALDQSGPRIVVFEVSGVIDGDITVDHGDVTIAGQTAPGAGITIRGRLYGRYDSSVNNIIVRFVRVRPTYDGSGGEQFDAIQFSRNSVLMLDHVSVSWGVDETIDLYSADDVTVQYCTIEESAVEGHPEGSHNYGLINGPEGARIAVHHNLFIHHKNRNPAIANGPADVRNNLIYNPRHGFVHHNPPSGPFNIVGNYYLRGNDDELFPFYFDDDGAGPGPGLAYHLADNYIEDPGVFTGRVDNPWARPLAHPSFEFLSMSEDHFRPAEIDFSVQVADYTPITTHASTEAFGVVFERAGAFPRDVVTRRLLEELQARTGQWGVSMPADLLEGLSPSAPAPDVDDDGMADDWELERGLDPSDGGDHNEVMPSGYTAIEEYLNALAEALVGGPPAGGAGGTGGGPGGAAGSGGAGGQPSGSGDADGADDDDAADVGLSCASGAGRSGADAAGALRWLALGLLLLPLAARRRRRVQ